MLMPYAAKESVVVTMRCVLVNMRDYIFSDALTQSLRADKLGNLSVEKVGNTDDVLLQCKIKAPYAVLLEVTSYPPYTLAERLHLCEDIKQEFSACKLVLAVDENAEPALAEQIRRQKKLGTIDQFIYCSISADYLAALIDTL